MFDTSYMIAAFVLSMLGTGFLIYGRKAPSLLFGLAGIALIAEPCLVFSSGALWLAGAITIGLMVVVRRFTGLE